MKKNVYVFSCVLILVMVAFVIGIVLEKRKNEQNPTLTPSDALPTDAVDMSVAGSEVGGYPLIVEGMFIGTVPENIRPVLLVNGTKYYWMGRSYRLYGADVPNGSVEAWPAINYFPKDYAEYGGIKEISQEEPTEDCQMKAAFSASGTIYTSELTPEAVYVWLVDDDTGEGQYIRFISEKLDSGQCIKWDGRYYLIKPAECEKLSQVPDNCETIGTLHYVGIDMMPEENLETNCPNDTTGFAFEGREAFFDADEPDYLYVYKTRDGKGVYKCPLLTLTQDDAHSVPEPTAAPGENYVFIADVIEIDGTYYHFRDLGEDSVPTKEEEENVIPQLQYLGRTTRVDGAYPQKELEANCLPEGTEVYYHADADKFAFFWEDKPYQWWYTGKYCVCDKEAMVPGKYYSFSEYGDDVFYSLGWIEEIYEYDTKILGTILEMKDGSMLIQEVTVGGNISYECLQTELYTQCEEDTRVYRKSRLSGEEDIDLTLLYYIYVKDNKVSAIIPVDTQN